MNREITRIITPGTIYESNLLDQTKPNYLASLARENGRAAICYSDISINEIYVIELDEDQINNELSRLNPNEILMSEKERGGDHAIFISNHLDKIISFQVDSYYASNKCEEIIKKFYNISSSSGLGSLSKLQISAIGSVLEYYNITQKSSKIKLSKPKILVPHKFMQIDHATRLSLELTHSANGKKATLLAALDKTITKSGSRLLYNFLSNPSCEIEEINNRLQKTEYFYNDINLTESLRAALRGTSDLERCAARLSMNKITPKDLISIKETIELAEDIHNIFTHNSELEAPSAMTSPLIKCSNIHSIINESIEDEAGNSLNDGGYIKSSFNVKVKEYKDLLGGANWQIEELKDKYKKLTNIDSLKIAHNNIIGLYIEVSAKNADKMTHEAFIHRQSNVGNARFTTNELQELELKIVNAKQLLIHLEKDLFDEICEQLMLNYGKLSDLASALGQIDLYTNLAYVARENNYSKPIIKDNLSLKIKNGRHGVIENIFKKEGKEFIANDCIMEHDNRLWLITGPNMAGKSTFLRQNALIVALAHAGSFVPAESAEIGLTDRIFSRIGSGDNLSKGQSTFMTEMLETSAIINQSTERSLLILDEVGRGTSTHDGLAIAWSVLEHIHDKIKARCMFATHYHELNDLTNILPATENYTIKVTEENNKVNFLHKIIPGRADKSYGIHVAEIAGLPESVINRANQILAKLEKDWVKRNKNILKHESANMDFFASPTISSGDSELKSNLDDNVRSDNAEREAASLFNEIIANDLKNLLEDLDINNLTPIEAMMKLQNVQKILKAKKPLLEET